MNMFNNYTKTENRLEKKFIIQENNYINFKSYLATNFFKKSYPDRLVNSIYLDTLNLDDLRDNINGVKNRTKHRFRWYNNNFDSVQFEQKNKNNFYGWKYKCSAGTFSNELELIKNITNKNIYKKIIFLNKFNFTPILKVSYKRSYWISKNNKVRVTLDKNLFTSQIYISKNNIKKKVYLDENIVEFKMLTNDEGYFRNLVNHSNLNLRIQKFSKYVRSFTELDCQGIFIKT